MIYNTADYISLMKARASGKLPEMGSALRVAGLIQERASRFSDRSRPVDLLDVGCAAGHYLRTLIRQGLPISRYVGLEIDPGMLIAAREVWAGEITAGVVEFVNQDLEQFRSKETFDFVICVNAFMYFASAKRALTNLLQATRSHLIIRSYFADANYRIMRGQTTRNHDKAQLAEIDAFDEDGNLLSFDYWNIYSFTYMETLVASLCPQARLEWIDDKNLLTSIEEERDLNIQKRGATEVLGEHEVSYPFILPWKYLSISLPDSRHKTRAETSLQ